MTVPHFYSGNNKKGPILILAPGATMIHFNVKHILVSTLKPIASQIISLELPGHGKRQLKDKTPLSFKEATHKMAISINSAVNSILQKKGSRKIGYIGFSLGGIFAMKINNPPFDFAIYLGCGNKYEEKQLQRINMFFSTDTFRRLKLIDNLKRDHGLYWQVMLEMINAWFSLDSDLVKNPIKSVTVPTLFIIAKNDQAYGNDAISLDGNYEIINVPGDHFSYFNSISFESYKQRMIDFIYKNNNLKNH